MSLTLLMFFTRPWKTSPVILLSFVKGLNFPELILFGVSSISEFEAINESWNDKKSIKNKLDFKRFKWDIEEDIDPRKWNCL